MKSKGISIFTLIFIGILIFGIGIGIGYLIPKNSSNTPINKPNVNTNTANTANIMNTTNTITNNVINNTITNTFEGPTTTENTIANSANPSEVKKVEELFRNFAKAVNAKDWATVEKYSSASIVAELKKYNVSNMLVGDDTIQENSNQIGGYTCLCSYNIDYNGLSVKDLGMGYIMSAIKVNDGFVVDNFRATGL